MATDLLPLGYAAGFVVTFVIAARMERRQAEPRYATVPFAAVAWPAVVFGAALAGAFMALAYCAKLIGERQS